MLLTFIQANYGWILTFCGAVIATGKILLYFRDRIKTHDESICIIDKSLKDNKVEIDHKIKILEDTIRCRDEAILNKLDMIVNELNTIKISNAKLIGVLSGKGIIKSDDVE